MVKHCCENLEAAVSDSRVPLIYTGYLREYALLHIDALTKSSIKYCPWCGLKFLEDLLEFWGAELDEMGLFNPFDEDRENVPEEFWSEKWWVDRGL